MFSSGLKGHEVEYGTYNLSNLGIPSKMVSLMLVSLLPERSLQRQQETIKSN